MKGIRVICAFSILVLCACASDNNKRIIEAIRNNDYATFSSLIEKGYDINSRLGKPGEQVPVISLLIDKDRRRTNMLELLLKKGAKTSVFVAEMTPLMTAVTIEDKEVVDLLLKYGADPNLGYVDSDNIKTCPLGLAAVKGNCDIYKTLSAKGASDVFLVQTNKHDKGKSINEVMTMINPGCL